MATTPRQVSTSTSLVNFIPAAPLNHEPATVEESPEDLDLISVLRKSATSAQPIDSLLDAVADAARVLSGSDGIALALQTKGVVVCRARSGTIAPELGTPMNSGSGISGECIRTATILVCHDALTDSRVDNEVCRSFDIRSIAAVPIRGAMGAVGILEAFSARPNAFDGDGLTSLRALAEIAETAYRREAPEAWLVGKALVPAITSAASPARQLFAEEVLGETKPIGGRFWMVAGIAIAMLMVVAVAWWSWQAPDYETASVRAASTEQPPSAPVGEMLPKPGPGVVFRGLDGRRPETVQNAADVIDLRHQARETTASLSSDNVPSYAGVESVPVDSPAPPDVALAPSAATADVVGLSSMPIQLPSAGPRVSDGVVEPALICKVDPAFPMQARTQHLSGKVVLSATIGSDGSITGISVVSGSPILASAAENAVRQWRYRPATLNGSPIVIQKQITVLFTLP